MRSIVVVGFIALVAFAASESAAETVATVGKTTITRAQLDAHLKAQLAELENQRYTALREGLDQLVGEELLTQEAKARGVSVEDLVKTEILDKAATPSDADVQKIYDENKDKLGNAPFDTIKPRLVDYLRQQSATQRRDVFLTELKAKYPTKVELRPPKIEVGTGGRPVLGPDKAPVTIIEFSDYECPFCKRAEESVQQVLKVYKDQVRFVYRDYPLPFHANARPAAEAANCAAAQGKFWEYHPKLMASKDLTPEYFKTLATEVGLDRTKFDACLAKNPYKEAIDKDLADGMAVGINGTPAFFINGRLLDGAQPFEKFKEVIDEEIAWAKQGG